MPEARASMRSDYSVYETLFLEDRLSFVPPTNPQGCVCSPRPRKDFKTPASCGPAPRKRELQSSRQCFEQTHAGSRPPLAQINTSSDSVMRRILQRPRGGVDGRLVSPTPDGSGHRQLQ